MTTPRWHVPEDVLVAHAAGTLPEALALIIATHLALCPACRALVADYEAVGGALLAEIPPAPLDPSALERTLARLSDPAPQKPIQTPMRADVPPLPEPLRSVVGDRPWRFIAPGIKGIKLPIQLGSEPVYLTRLSGPMRVPHHGHAGIEAQLVLSGGFTSTGRHIYERGDVQWADESLVHEVDVHPGEPCVTLLVRDAKLVQSTLRGRLFSWLTGT